MQDELIELQTKLAFLEDTIDALNVTAADQENRIRALEHSQKAVAEQLRGISASLAIERGSEPPPPHY